MSTDLSTISTLVQVYDAVVDDRAGSQTLAALRMVPLTERRSALLHASMAPVGTHIRTTYVLLTRLLLYGGRSELSGDTHPDRYRPRPQQEHL